MAFNSHRQRRAAFARMRTGQKYYNHTAEERRVIRDAGGKPHVGYGVDGELADGSPVEVRSSRVDERYRIGRGVHEKLLKENGYYIFVNRGESKKMSAAEVDKKLSGDRWLKDRTYPHRFLKKSEVFTK